MKKSKLWERRKRNCILLVWSLLGLIGFLWLISLPVRLLAGSLSREEQVAAGESTSEPTLTAPPFVSEGNEDVQANSSTDVGQVTDSADENNASEIVSEECQRLYEEYEELLVLVNRDHELEEGSYEDTLRSICNGRLQASEYLYEDLVDMMAAAGEEGYQYWFASAYRSRARQQELVDEDVNHYMAQGMSHKEALEKTYEQTMPAGKSEHETGLALDLLCSGNLNMDITQADEPGNKWLAEHAHEYGFILRYPEDKEDITGIYYEPWHFRYVGKEAADFLYQNRLTLEEFHEYVEK